MYKGKIFSFIAVLLLLGLSSCHDDEPGNNRFDPEVGYDYYVAVFYNSEDSLAKKNMAEWAAADFADAQKSMSKQLSVGIRRGTPCVCCVYHWKKLMQSQESGRWQD